MLKKEDPIGRFPLSCCFVDFVPRERYGRPALIIVSPDSDIEYIFGAESKLEIVEWANFIKNVAFREMRMEKSLWYCYFII